MNRALLVALPLVAVLVVAFALLVVGAPRTRYAAELYGGPTEGASHLSWRVSVLQEKGGVTAPASVAKLRVRARLRDGRRFAWHGAVDASGMAGVSFDLGRPPASGPVQVEISTPAARRPLAAGPVQLSRARWFSKARFGGGWIDGKQTGALRVRAAPGRGAFAVPFRDPLWIEVRDDKGPVAGVRLRLSGESLDLSERSDLVTDGRGRAQVQLAPRDFYVALSIVATAPDGRRGSWYSTLPVVVGALHAERVKNRLSVESPVARRLAYYAVIDEHERLQGGPLALAPDARGGARASLLLQSPPAGPLWAIVSSEPELDSPSTVGWPLAGRAAGGAALFDTPGGPPPRTLVVQDRLLLDGLPGARAREAARRRRARLLALAFSLLSALLVVLLLIAEVRAAHTRLVAHLSAAGQASEQVERISARRGLFKTVAVAVVCIALGFIAVALVAMYKIG